DARRLPAGTGGGEDRHLDPLPPGAPALGVRGPPLPSAAAAAGDGACGRRGAVAAALACPLGGRHPGRGGLGPPRPRTVRMIRSRRFRLGATIVVTGLAAAYIVAKINIGKTLDIIGSASPWWLLLSAALTIIPVPPQAWRWQLLLKVRGVYDSL